MKVKSLLFFLLRFMSSPNRVVFVTVPSGVKQQIVVVLLGSALSGVIPIRKKLIPYLANKRQIVVVFCCGSEKLLEVY